MKKYQHQEWWAMVTIAKENLEGDCPLVEDEVVVAVNEDYQQMKEFVEYIATEWCEMSCDKVTLQRNDFVKRAKNLLERLNDYDVTKG